MVDEEADPEAGAECGEVGALVKLAVGLGDVGGEPAEWAGGTAGAGGSPGDAGGAAVGRPEPTGA